MNKVKNIYFTHLFKFNLTKYLEHGLVENRTFLNEISFNYTCKVYKFPCNIGTKQFHESYTLSFMQEILFQTIFCVYSSVKNKI